MKLNLCGCVAFLASLTSLPVMASGPQTQVFTSGGKPIHVDVYQASGPGTHPSIIFVYGSDGMAILPWSYVATASWFASNGYNFYIVHYFDRSGTIFADPFSDVAYFGAWTQTLDDAAVWVGSQPGADPHQIGLMGMSLGSYLAINEAGHNPRIKALVEWYGGLIDTTITRMPPTLILHGVQDPLVPVSEAYKLQSFLLGINTPNQMHVYPAEGHGFNLGDQLDALQRSLAFFQQYMSK